jgi:hypothetical protein
MCEEKMKVVGLCKALTCNSFIPAVIDGIYDYLDKIVFVYPQVSWNKMIVENSVKLSVKNFRKSNDRDKKIVEIDTTEETQIDQYRYAIRMIVKTMSPDWIFLFDTDEVWDKTNLEKLFSIAEALIFENSICVSMKTYIKSPLYMISPPEPCRPCVMIRGINGIFNGVRGNKTNPRHVNDDIFFHHFSYVRESYEELIVKIKNSTFADGLSHINLDNWKDEKWDKLPYSINLHTTKGAENFWGRVDVIEEAELPKSVTELKIYKERAI